jgi:hypothetical protein
MMTAANSQYRWKIWREERDGRYDKRGKIVAVKPVREGAPPS